MQMHIGPIAPDQEIIPATRQTITDILVDTSHLLRDGKTEEALQRLMTEIANYPHEPVLILRFLNTFLELGPIANNKEENDRIKESQRKSGDACKILFKKIDPEATLLPATDNRAARLFFRICKTYRIRGLYHLTHFYAKTGLKNFPDDTGLKSMLFASEMIRQRKLREKCQPSRSTPLAQAAPSKPAGNKLG